uniref:C2H2-type domain-containing protein n=1 Tax=Panagrolaimus davidi TaxID=227884 RepID=A0A914R064_9BILA
MEDVNVDHECELYSCYKCQNCTNCNPVCEVHQVWKKDQFAKLDYYLLKQILNADTKLTAEEKNVINAELASRLCTSPDKIDAFCHYLERKCFHSLNLKKSSYKNEMLMHQFLTQIYHAKFQSSAPPNQKKFPFMTQVFGRIFKEISVYGINEIKKSWDSNHKVLPYLYKPPTELYCRGTGGYQCVICKQNFKTAEILLQHETKKKFDCVERIITAAYSEGVEGVGGKAFYMENFEQDDHGILRRELFIFKEDFEDIIYANVSGIHTIFHSVKTDLPLPITVQSSKFKIGTVINVDPSAHIHGIKATIIMIDEYGGIVEIRYNMGAITGDHAPLNYFVSIENVMEAIEQNKSVKLYAFEEASQYSELSDGNFGDAASTIPQQVEEKSNVQLVKNYKMELVKKGKRKDCLFSGLIVKVEKPGKISPSIYAMILGFEVEEDVTDVRSQHVNVLLLNDENPKQQIIKIGYIYIWNSPDLLCNKCNYLPKLKPEMSKTLFSTLKTTIAAQFDEHQINHEKDLYDFSNLSESLKDSVQQTNETFVGLKRSRSNFNDSINVTSKKEKTDEKKDVEDFIFFDEPPPSIPQPPPPEIIQNPPPEIPQEDEQTTEIEGVAWTGGSVQCRYCYRQFNLSSTLNLHERQQCKNYDPMYLDVVSVRIFALRNVDYTKDGLIIEQKSLLKSFNVEQNDIMQCLYVISMDYDKCKTWRYSQARRYKQERDNGGRNYRDYIKSLNRFYAQIEATEDEAERKQKMDNSCAIYGGITKMVGSSNEKGGMHVVKFRMISHVKEAIAVAPLLFVDKKSSFMISSIADLIMDNFDKDMFDIVAEAKTNPCLTVKCLENIPTDVVEYAEGGIVSVINDRICGNSILPNISKYSEIGFQQRHEDGAKWFNVVQKSPDFMLKFHPAEFLMDNHQYGKQIRVANSLSIANGLEGYEEAICNLMKYRNPENLLEQFDNGKFKNMLKLSHQKTIDADFGILGEGAIAIRMKEFLITTGKLETNKNVFILKPFLKNGPNTFVAHLPQESPVFDKNMKVGEFAPLFGQVFAGVFCFIDGGFCCCCCKRKFVKYSNWKADFIYHFVTQHCGEDGKISNFKCDKCNSVVNEEKIHIHLGYQKRGPRSSDVLCTGGDFLESIGGRGCFKFAYEGGGGDKRNQVTMKKLAEQA